MRVHELTYFLCDNSACNIAMNWLQRSSWTLPQLWKRCERGDWMLWLLIRVHKVGDQLSYEKELKPGCVAAAPTLFRETSGLKPWYMDIVDEGHCDMYPAEMWDVAEAIRKVLRWSDVEELVYEAIRYEHGARDALEES